MSQNKQATLPDEQTAFNTIATRVANAVFFHKCASAGMTPRTEDEARHMLECSYKLAALREQEQVKAAAAGRNPFAVLNQAADGLMERFGLSQQKAATDLAAECREISRGFAADPDVYNSILSLKAAQVERNKTLAAA